MAERDSTKTATPPRAAVVVFPGKPIPIVSGEPDDEEIGRRLDALYMAETKKAFDAALRILTWSASENRKPNRVLIHCVARIVRDCARELIGKEV